MLRGFDREQAGGPCALKKKGFVQSRVKQSMDQLMLARHWESLNLLQGSWGILTL